MIDVEIKDRNPAVEYLRMALAMSEFGVSYTQADLIFKTVGKLQKLQGKFSLSDGAELFNEWKNSWTKYGQNKIKSEKK